jgi:hypothetical protein
VLVRWDKGPPQENRFFPPQLPHLGAGKETTRGSPLDFRAQSKVTLKLYQVYPAPLASLLPTRPPSKPQSNLSVLGRRRSRALGNLARYCTYERQMEVKINDA